MAAPSKNFTSIADGVVDADSPLDTTLVSNLRDNDIHLEEWLGKNYTAAVDHDHDDVNSKAVASVADAAISQAKLKTVLTGEVYSNPGPSNLTLPGGTYGFYPQVKANAAANNVGRIGAGIINTTYATIINLDSGGGGGGEKMYAQQRYVSASPPHMLGARTWGHFLFLLRHIGTGIVAAGYHAADPPWEYNGKVWLPKGHVDRIAEIPHPFADYWDKDPATDGLEVVLVDLIGIDVDKWLDDNLKNGKSIFDDLDSVLTGMGTDKPWSDYTVPTIPRFTDRVKVITP